MNDEAKEESLRRAKAVLKMIAQAYPNLRMDEEMAMFWIEEIVAIGDNRAEYNAKQYIRSGAEFAPSLGKLLVPNDYIEAEKRKKQTEHVMQENEIRQKRATTPPWIKAGVTWDQWMAGLKDRE